MILHVYVPKDDRYGILPGSGIVGSPVEIPAALRPVIIEADEPARVRIDYEGGKFRQTEYEDFERRLLHAADRHTWNNGRGYPTIARMVVPAEELIEVGTYDYDSERRVYRLEVTDKTTLDAWIARYATRFDAR
jgi:hypothetical protein